MINLAILFLLLGIALLLVEVFMPGFGVFGISGLISLAVSAVLTVLYVPFGTCIVLAEVAVFFASAWLLLKYIRQKQFFGKILLDETLNFEEEELGDMDYLVGKEGVTRGPLKPFGKADFNGTLLDVCSDGGFIKENSRVKVISVENNKIIVTQIQSVQIN